MKHFLIVSSWFATSLTTLLVSLWAYSLVEATTQKSTALHQETQVLGAADEQRQPYLAYAAIPQSVTELKTALKTKDARPLIVRNYLEHFESPMIGSEEFIIQKADQLGATYSIDSTYLAFLTIAIAQNESNLGKRMPPDCYNAWGYGIHSSGTLCFESWEQGIEKFMTGVAKDFIAGRGLQTPEEIMTRYTPHSPNGAWAKGVKQFLEELYSGELK